MREEITKWIASLPGVLEAAPCQVTIQGETWEACRYKREFEAGPGARNPGKYVRDAIMCVGHLPKAKQKHPRSVCFPFEGKDWYVAGHSSTEAKNEYQPFGYFFMLMPWDIPDSKIDDGERFTYKRFPMTVVK
jgi:hypothetical protein